MEQGKMAWTKQRKLCAVLVVAGILIVTITLLRVYFNLQKCENDGDLLYKGNRKCYPQGLQGPCCKNLVLMEKSPGNPYGMCTCAYMEHNRTLLYDWRTNQCYFIFSEAYCGEGNWLNTTRKGEPFCEKNKCIEEFAESDSIPDEIIPLKGGQCGILGRQNHCTENQTLQFYRNFIYPRCENPKIANAMSGTVLIRPSDCPTGSYDNIVGKCQPDFVF